MTRSLDSVAPASRGLHQDFIEVLQEDVLSNLRFGFFDDSGLPRDSRILMFYSFEGEGHSARSGILHYHVTEGRFVGPRHDAELTRAALEFLSRSGRLAAASTP